MAASTVAAFAYLVLRFGRGFFVDFGAATPFFSSAIRARTPHGRASERAARLAQS